MKENIAALRVDDIGGERVVERDGLNLKCLIF